MILPTSYNIVETWDFGDGELAEKLKNLVLSGVKTATTGIYRDGQFVPKVGDHAQIADQNKKPFCVIKYTKVEVKKFMEVGYDFARLEGEGDKSIEDWRNSHRTYFKKYYKSFEDNSLVICEEYELISVI
ncbi:MAG: RNA-binding protein [Candidatus Doudnabacteria bacterium]|nr:RNA-binding protein [Candidatus Doudnabacteria bacterium]